MGIDTEAARFLLARQREGATFSECATLGRQHFFVGNKEIAGILREFGLSSYEFPKLSSPTYPPFSEPFWEMLGVKKLTTIDVSRYEGATHIHDMNLPIPIEWKEAYDVVCDVGTLEHIFNFPVAIRNCMEMVKCGGHLFLHTSANNDFGHGFYQFSPELFFRVLSPENGFKVEHCVAIEHGLFSRWYAVTDPERVRARGNIINSSRVTMLVWARRTEIRPIFQMTPQQSDYAATWSDEVIPDSPNIKHESPMLQRLKRTILESTPRLARMLDRLRFSRFNRAFSFKNRSSFTRIPKRR